MEFSQLCSKLKQIKENVGKKMDKIIKSDFFVRMQPEEGPSKFYPHYYGYIRVKIKTPSYHAANQDHLPERKL